MIYLASHAHEKETVASVLSANFSRVFDFARFNEMQTQCIDSVLRTSDNLVVGAPTGSGKTALFELAMIRHVAMNERNAVPPQKHKIFYVAPMKAIASERLRDWRVRLGRIGLKFLEVTGDTIFGSPSEFTRSVARSDVILT